MCPIIWFADVRLCHNKNTLTHFAEHKSSRAHLLKFCIHKILCLWNFLLLFTWDDQNLETKCSFTHIFLLVFLLFFLLVQWIVWNSFLSEQYLKKIPWGHGSLREHTFSLRELAPTHNVGKCRKIFLKRISPSIWCKYRCTGQPRATFALCFVYCEA